MSYHIKLLIGIFILIYFSAGIVSAGGDNLWNVRIDAGDYFDSNEFWLRPWNTNYDNGYGTFVGSGGFDIFYDSGPYHQPVVNTGSVYWITYPNGDFYVSYAPDHQIHAWTYLYVDVPTTIYLPQYNVGGVPRLFLNYNFDSPMERVTGPVYLNLQPGENRLDFTVYDQNEGHEYQLGYDLASAVDMMSSTQYIDDNIITPDEMPYIIDDQEVIEHGNYFEVSGDWTSSSTDNFAIMVTASDVTLNGGGYLLSGTLDSDGSTTQTGILVTGNNVDVQNVKISGWDTGISYSGVEGGSILNNQAFANFQNGIVLETCTAVTVEGNTVNENTDTESGFGIGVFNSQNVDVKTNDAQRNRVGVFYHNVEGGNIFQNDVSNCQIHGINIYSDSVGITIEENIVRYVLGGQDTGSIHIGGENNQNIDILNNEVSGSNWTGIMYMHVTTGHIVGNTVTGNTRNGINILNCNAITVESNTVTDNRGQEYSTGITAFSSQNIDTKANIVTGNNAGLYYHSVDGGNILNNNASNSVILGIGIGPGASSITIDGNTVQNVKGSSTSNGIQVGGENLNVMSITNNQVSGCSGNGIQFDHVTTGHILNNSVTGNSVNGIHMDACVGVTVQSNTVTGNIGSPHSTGIIARDSQNIDVKTNTATGNKAGIYFENVTGGNVLTNDASNSVIMGIGVMSGPTLGSSSITVDGNIVCNVVGDQSSMGIMVGGDVLNEVINIQNNQVSGCSGSGISFTNVATGQIFSNEVTGIGMHGISIGRCNAITIEGNTVTGNTKSQYATGIFARNSLNINVKTNTATGNKAGIYYENVTGGNVLTNDASSSVIMGIGVMGSSSSINVDGNTVNNVVGSETSNGIQVGGGNLGVIDIGNNQVSGCTGTGIQYNRVTTGHIFNNTVTGNTMNGINLVACDKISIDGNIVTDNTGSEHSFGIVVINSSTIDTRLNDVTRNRAGIFYTNVTGGNIVGNDASTSVILGIGVMDSSSSINVDGNTVNNVVGSETSNGIQVGGGNLGVIDLGNNQVSGCAGTGIQYNRVTTGHIFNNTVTGNTMNGINLVACDKISIDGNTVTDNTGSEHSFGIVVINSSTIDTRLNDVTRNRAGIFYTNVTGGNIVGNDASTSMILGIGVMDSSSSINVDGNTVNNVVGSETSNGIQVGGGNLGVIDLGNNQVSGCTGAGIQYNRVTTGHIFNNTVTGNTMNGINLVACDKISIDGNTVTDNTGSEHSFGIVVINSSTIDTRLNDVTRNRAGIFYTNVTGGNIVGNDVSTSVNLGIGVMDSSSSINVDGNTVNNVKSSEKSNGIQVGGGNLGVIDLGNNQVSGCTGTGIQYNRVTTGHIFNNTVTGNTMNGINMDTCAGVTVENNTVTGNANGIFTGNSKEIIIGSNIIIENNLGLILANSSNSQIFNNQFNNQNNAAVDETSNNNSWNSEKINLENIMGGPYLGGNFWATPQHNGFSEITPDFDGDGFCDTEFVIQDGNVDNLPLKWPLPTAQFTTDINSGVAPLTVVFTDRSTGPDIDSWTWEFGDGSTSTVHNPVFTYTKSGHYTVKLTVSNSAGNNTRTIGNCITVTNPVELKANFIANSTKGQSPLTVQFTDSSTDTPTDWLWNFGDGGTSSERNPIYTYLKSGHYTVTMTIKNNIGSSDTLTKKNYIKVI